MYSKLQGVLDRLADGIGDVIRYAPDDTRLAIAVLYYRVILVDGRVRDEELDRFRAILSASLDVSEDELALFEENVIEQTAQETSLSSVIQTLKKLPLNHKLEVLRHMHQISISDRELHEFEINLVAQAAEMLDIDPSFLDGPDSQPPDPDKPNER